MEKDLVIQTSDKGAEIALLENKQLVELHTEKFANEFQVGDIYLGRVKKVLTGLNACFVDIGHKKDAFLHYLDLGPNIPSSLKFSELVTKKHIKNHDLSKFIFLPEIVKKGKINEVLSQGQKVIVQIVKEPISSKGPRLSSELAIPGRFIILIPFSNTIAISKKITSKQERSRLRKIIEGVKPKNYGVIVRTLAENKPESILHDDLNNLLDKWHTVYKNLQNEQPKLLGELDKMETILRDLLNDSFNKIVVDRHDFLTQLKDYIHQISPGQENIVKFHNKPEPVFNAYSINKQIKSLFGKTINMTGGAYIIIEHTEALHVIDINSGSKRNKEGSQEDNAVNTNIEAVIEIARQLRLRDMGGIIVLDLIDMRAASNRKIVFDKMKDVMKHDRAKHTVLPISKFGLMQITRQRVKPELNISTNEKCPMCLGSGEVNATIVITDEIENRLTYLLKEKPVKKISIICHPFVHAFLTKGLYSEKIKWMMKYKIWLKINADQNLPLSRYKFLDDFNEEIIL